MNLEERNWAIAIHLSILVNYLIPPAGLIAVIVYWFVLIPKFPVLKHHVKEALNFQISMWLFGIIGTVVSFLTFGILGFIIYPALIIITIVLSILAASKSSKGEDYVYPLSVRFIA